MNIRTPPKLNIPTYLLNFPFTVDNHTANNVLMHSHRNKYDYSKVFKQFMGLYDAIVKEGSLVYLLPSEEDFQDLPYTANLGCYLPHLTDDTIILAKFKSEPRQGEDRIGKKFLESMRYKVVQCPYFWEGEADLKWIRNNLYIGGFGIRSSMPSYWWMSSTFNMEIVQVFMSDPKLYHFDCVFFPITDEKALVSTSVLEEEGIKSIEKHVEIIDVPKQHIYDGWTNALRIHNKILYNIPETIESRKALDNLLSKLGFEPVGINLGEFDKSGADLSCFCMHLNTKGRN